MDLVKQEDYKVEQEPKIIQTKCGIKNILACFEIDFA